MKGNIDNPSKVSLVQIDISQFIVAAGAAGWVDTDVSAAVGSAWDKVWVIGVNALAAGDFVGARIHGSALSPYTKANNTLTLMSMADSSGHMDLYRQAGGNVEYNFIGYLDG